MTSLRILVLGASGFIGSAVVRSLAAAEHRPTGLARSVARQSRTLPDIEWISADVAEIGLDEWWRLLGRHDAVVNCAGALQDGLQDDLEATQERAMKTMYEAARCLGGRLVVQVSARTEGAASGTKFLSTKRRADEALATSGLPYVILRPALVVGRNAHGGTSLIRALAALPVAVPLVHAESVVRTVALDDVAGAVLDAVDGRLAAGSDVELASPERKTLAELVTLHRAWLGLPPASIVALPRSVAAVISKLADAAGMLGWRSPLRTTAMKVMVEGVDTGDRIQPARGAAEALLDSPSGVQDLWAARLYLAKPLVLVTLSLFWVASGLVPLADVVRAAAHFHPYMGPAAATALTLATCLLDVVLGMAALHRRIANAALLGMIATSAAYICGATMLEPELWADPLGPLVKVLPSIVLALVGLAILDER